MSREEQQRELVRRRLLGWGLAAEELAPGVDLGRDIRFERDADGRLDLAAVEGMENLEQALVVAFTTLLGSDVFNVQFGFDGLNALVEESNPIMMRERIRIAAIQVLRKDPRVRRIIDVKLADGQLDSPTPGSRELDVRVVFETVSAEQTDVALGRIFLNG